jgi:hypothetical protein
MVITARPKPKRSAWMLAVLAVILTCALGVAIAQDSPTVWTVPSLVDTKQASEFP